MTSMTNKPSQIFKHLLLAGLVTGMANMATAAIERLDRVAVVVNDDIIMESQVLKRKEEITQAMQRQGVALPPDDEVLRQVVEALIIENIQLQIGERAGVRIDDNTLNQTMARIAQQNNLTLEEFQQQLQADGMSYAQTREQIRNEMVATRVREGKVGSRIQITEQEIQNYLTSETGQKQLEAAYLLGHILLQVPEDTGAEFEAQASQRAQSILDQLRDGADFAQLAAKYSDDPSAAAGGAMEWRKASQLPSIFADVATELNIGEVSEPIRSANGFHLIKLLNRQGGDSLLVPQSRVRHILIKTSEIRNDDQAKAFAEELFGRIQGGEDFAELARKYSADTGSLASGGDLGWVSGRDLVPEFRMAMEGAELNQLTQPVRSQFGWHILEVLEHRMQDVGKEVQKARAREVIYQRKFDEELQIWLNEEREDAFVDIKLY